MALKTLSLLGNLVGVRGFEPPTTATPLLRFVCRIKRLPWHMVAHGDRLMTRLPLIRHIRALLWLARCARYQQTDTLGWLCDVWRGER